MKIHNFFPLSIFIDQINLNQKDKDIIVNEIIFLAKESNLLEYLTPHYSNWKQL